MYKNFKALNKDWEVGVAPVIAVLLNLLPDPSAVVSARAGLVLGRFWKKELHLRTTVLLDSESHPLSLASLLNGNKGFQETASNMEAFQRIRDLLSRLARPVEPYETDIAAQERSRQQQVNERSLIVRQKYPIYAIEC